MRKSLKRFNAGLSILLLLGLMVQYVEGASATNANGAEQLSVVETTWETLPAAAVNDADEDAQSAVVERINNEESSSWSDSSFFKPAYTPTGEVTISSPGPVFLGEDFSLEMTFNNNGDTSGHGSTGYGPFIDLYVPRGTVAGDGGISPAAGGNDFKAFHNGEELTLYVNTFANTSNGICVTHPIGLDVEGKFLEVCDPNAVVGDQLVTMELPYGSYTPDQATIDVSMDLTLDSDASIDELLALKARGGYKYGATPEVDWCCTVPPDTTILSDVGAPSGWTPSADVPARVIGLEKESTSGNNPSGPNYPQTYSILLHTAHGEVFRDVRFTDSLPPNMVYMGGMTVTDQDGGAIAAPVITFDEDGAGPITPVVGMPVAESGPYNGATIEFDFTGNDLSNGVLVTFDYYIPATVAGTGSSTTDTSYDNTVLLDNATWVIEDNPIDPDVTRDFTSAEIGPGVAETQGEIMTLGKSNQTVGGVAFGPGAQVRYQIHFDLSDYYGIDNIVVEDILPDGLHFDSSIEPTLTVVMDGGTAINAVDFDSANYSVMCDYNGASVGPECDTVEADTGNNTGETVITYAFSDELIAQLGNGQLHGGEVNDNLPSSDGPTNATITYYAVVQDMYMRTGYTEFVKMGDDLQNVANLTAALLDVDNCDTGTHLCPPNGSTLGGASGIDADSSESVPQGDLTKDIVAINGTACDPVNLNACSIQNVMTGDVVTYRIQQEIPTGDFSNLTIKDYLPLPIFLAENPDNLASAPTTIWQESTSGAVVPPVGEWQYGPAHTYTPINNTFSPLPTITYSPSNENNYLQFEFGTDNSSSNTEVLIDLLFSIRVTDLKYGDGLTLRNHVESFDTNSPGQTNSAQNNVDLILNEPALEPTKSVVAVSGSTSAELVPDVTDYGFFDPGTPGKPWSTPSVINSDFFDANGAPDSSATGLDAGDLLRYAVLIENTGNSADGAFDIQIADVLPDQLQVPAGSPGLNLQVWLGDGTTEFTLDNSASPADNTYRFVDPGAGSLEAALFGDGIELNDPGSASPAYGEGACQGHDATNGKNIIVVTYDLQLKPDLEVGEEIVNSGGVKNYSSTEGGDNYSPGDDFDDSSVIVGDLAIEKTVVSSEYDDGADNALLEATIGEIVTYQVVVTLPEASTKDVKVVDTLDRGLGFLRVVPGSFVMENSDGTTLTGVLVNESDVDITMPSTTTGTNGSDETTLTWDFGTIVNKSDDDPVTETIAFSYEVMVLDSESDPTIEMGVDLENDVEVQWQTPDLDTPDDTDYKDASTQPSSTPTIRVVEPELVVEKDVTPTSNLEAGNAISYTIVLKHEQASGSPDDYTDAYDVTFEDPLPLCVSGESFILIDDSSAATIEASYGVSDTDLGSPVVKGTDIELVGDNATGWTLQTPAGHSFDMPYDTSREITITISGEVSYCASAGESYQNTAVVKWSSMDGTVEDRNGDSAPDGTDNERDTYSAENSATSAVAGVTEPTLIKSIFATSDVESENEDLAIGETITYQLALRLPQSTASDVVFTDVIPAGLEYVTDSTTLSIDSDVPMTIDADLNAANGIGLTAPGLNVSDTTDIDGNDFVSVSGSVNTGQTVTISLGDIENNDEPTSGTTTADETVIVRFDAVVLDLDTVNTVGDVKTNEFSVEISGNNFDSNEVTSVIVEPDLAIEKTNSLVSTNCVDVSDSSGTSYLNCIGATIGYVVKVTNPYFEADGVTRTYSSVGWDTTVEDLIPLGLTINESSLQAEWVDVSSGSEVRTAVGTAGSGWILGYAETGSPVTEQKITLSTEAGTRFDEDDDQWIEISYQVVIDDIATEIGDSPVVVNVPQPGDTLTNTVEVTWSSENGDVTGEREYSEDTDSDVTVENADIVVDKFDATLALTGSAATFEAGSKVYYGITFENVGNGATEFSLSETLPANTTYDATTTDQINSNEIVGSPTTDTWTYNATSGEYEAVPVTNAGTGVLEAAGSTDGTTGDATDRGTWYFVVDIVDPLPAGVTSITNTAIAYPDETTGGPAPNPEDNEDTFTGGAVGEPNLVIEKTDSQYTTTVGETLVYTITYRNNGGQDATGVELQETVPAGTTWFDDPAVTTDDGWSCDAVGAAGEDCVWTIGDLAASPTDVHTVTFALLVDAGATVSTVNNEVQIEDDGSNNTTGTTPQSDTDSDEDVLIQGMEKHLVSISEPAATAFDPSGNDAAVGAILVYQIDLEIPSTATGNDDILVPNFVLTDVLDAGLAFVGCGDGSGTDAVTASGGLTSSTGPFADLCDRATEALPTSTAGTSPTVSAYPIGNGDAVNQGRHLRFDFGTITNDNESSTTQTISIVYRVVVLDDASVVVGSGERNNHVEAIWDEVNNPMTAEAESIEIVEPFLNIEKNVSRTIVPVGGTIEYTLRIYHEGRSTTSAYDVNVYDTIPNGLEYELGSIAHDSGEVPDSMTYDTGTRQLTIHYDDWDPTGNTESVITFEAEVVFYPSGSIVNHANVEWTSLPGPFETVEQSPFNELSHERYYDPLDNVDIYGAATSIAIEPPIVLPETGFAPDVVTEVGLQPLDLAYYEVGTMWLSIPTLGVSGDIVGIPEAKNTWDASWLQHRIGYLTGTAFPTQAGKTLLAGHVVDEQGNPSVFADLHLLQWGDEFVIHANGLKYVYEVHSNERIEPDDTDVFSPSAYDEVTLITCQGYNEDTGLYEWRIAVNGVLIRVEK